MKAKEARDLVMQVDLWREKYESLERQYDKLRERLDAQMLGCADVQELKEGQFVWIQLREGELYCLRIVGLCGVSGRYTDIQFESPSTFEELRISRYRSGWVAWTAQPTDDQRKAVRWDV